MKSILEYLEKTVLRTPEKTAFVCENDSISFNDLKEKSQIIGVHLAKKLSGVRNEPICIIADRSIETLICMFACLYSGNYYVIVDSALPTERIQLMIESVDFAGVIDCSNGKENIDNSNVIFKYGTTDNEVLSEEDRELIALIRSESRSFDPMYGIFTSGSTGVPKLVVKSHQALISFIDSFVEMFEFTSDEILGNQFPFYFDASTKDIFVCLKCGITTYIIPKKMFSFPTSLVEYIENKKITTIVWVPSALSLVANAGALDGNNYLSRLRKVFFVGEQMPVKQLNYWKRNLINTRFINLYGSTEVAGNFLFYEYNTILDDESRLPTGKVFPNVKVFLLNEDDKLVTDNEMGEICVAGETLSLGYYKNKTLTDKVFVQNPLVDYREIIYKTGDIATYDQSGNIVWKSRKDFQIKHMGFRIELSEIETIIGSIPEIEECCCTYDSKQKKILLFYQAKTDLKSIIGKKVRSSLPKYMYPGKYYRLEQMPHNANGKIDRRLLKEKTMSMEKK